LHYFQIKYVIRWLGVPCFVLMLGCAPLQVKDGILSPPHKNYTVTIPGKGWELVKAGKEDVALWHKQYHAMIAVISSDIENKGFSLETLNRHLFIGMTGKKIVSKESVLVDNQKALHTIVESEMDNCKLKIDSYVIKVGDKVYDLVCWSSIDMFNHVQTDFESMVRNFKFTRREG